MDISSIYDFDLSQEQIATITNLIEGAIAKDDTPFTEQKIITEYLKYNPLDDVSVFLNMDLIIAPDIMKSYPNVKKIPLKQDKKINKMGLIETIELRASRRDYSNVPISFVDLSNIIYYSYGKRGTMWSYNKKNFPLRNAPTAGNLQSAEVYIVVNNVEGIEKGLYHYFAEDNCLELLERGTLRFKLAECCIEQNYITDANFTIILTSVMDRLTWKYSKKTYRYVHLDAGIIIQNMHLLCTAQKIRSCIIAGFRDDEINKFLNIDGENEFVTILMSAGTTPWNLKK